MKLYTIGFTKKSAERFFGLLKQHGVQSLLDIRLHPGGQLAGFAKQDDLTYFLRELVDCEYHHLPQLAPTDEILSDYRKDHQWDTYVRRFETLMDERSVPQTFDRAIMQNRVCCLLCSEATPDQCHRRLVADRFVQQWPELEIVHLV